jgi:hypothetical protein
MLHENKNDHVSISSQRGLFEKTRSEQYILKRLFMLISLKRKAKNNLI